MTIEARTALRLQFLARVVRKECRQLVATANLMVHEAERRVFA